MFENYSMHMLSTRRNDFIAYWAYKETISSHTESTPNKFSRMLNAQPVVKNIHSFYIYIHAEHTGKQIHRTLSLRGNDVNAGWAYAEMI